ncbi:FadR/GntR family transcriptional regulator [Streptomyces sp. NPDC059605]|uniref:FadR/GntR family transcriptional regulator n=1 Tax=unclassified Streptomyces TaxID=2593676 RepID=UPI0036C1EF63
MAALVEEPGAGDPGGDGFGDVVGGALEAGDLRHEGGHAADIAFHAALARASRNDMFSLTLDALEPLLQRLRRRVWSGWVSSGGDLASIVEAHAVILERVRAGDADGAGKAMSDHLAQARHGLENPAHNPAVSE